MIGREEAIQIALNLAETDPMEDRPVVGAGHTFTVDNGLTWTVHIEPEPWPAEGGGVWFSTGDTWVACVDAKTGEAVWQRSW